MTRKTKLEVVEPNFHMENLSDSPYPQDADASLTLEQIIADELLDSIDWKALNKALLANIQRKFIRWLVHGSSSTIATNEIEAQAIASGELTFDDEVAA